MATIEERRAAWLAERRKHITATDASALLGVSVRSPLDVYLDKRGELEQEQTERMEWGNRLQEAILIGYSDRTGRAVELADPFEVRSGPGVLAATFDAEAMAPGGVRVPVDAKNVGWKRPDLWGEPGTDEIPDQYLVQLTVQMIVAKATLADLAVLFGGNRLEIFTVRFNEKLAEEIQAAADRFWRENVEPGVPPAVDASKAWAQRLSRSRQEDSLMVRAGPTEEVAAIALAHARARKTAAEEDELLASNLLKAAIGPAAGMTGPGWRVTFKQTKAPESVDWQGVAIDYAMHLDRLLQQINKRRKKRKVVIDTAEIIRSHTEVGTPSRRFLFKSLEDEKAEK